MKSVLRLVPLLFFAQIAYGQELYISITNQEDQPLVCMDMPVREILPGQTFGFKISVDKSKNVAFKQIRTGLGDAGYKYGYKYIVSIIPFPGGAFFVELFENQKGGGSTALTVPNNRDLIIVIDKTGRVAVFSYEMRK